MVLKEKYVDEVVAVHRRQVIADGEDAGSVLGEVHRIAGFPKDLIAITTILGPRLLFSPRE
jgi:hypothetical protein